MYRNPYFVLKLFLTSFLVVVTLLVAHGANPLVALIASLPQLPFVLLISYAEFKYKTSIFNFPIMLSSTALSSLLGVTYGIVGLIKAVNVSVNDFDLIAAALIHSLIGFLTMAFVGFIAGMVIHFGQPPEK